MKMLILFTGLFLLCKSILSQEYTQYKIGYHSDLLELYDNKKNIIGNTEENIEIVCIAINDFIYNSLKIKTEKNYNYAIVISKGKIGFMNYYNKDRLYRTGSVQDTTSLNDKIKLGVEFLISQWQKKGEFEKKDDYYKRVNEKNRIKIANQFKEFIIEELKKQCIDAISWDREWFRFVGSYDSENETFLVHNEFFGDFIINVPIKIAEDFRNRYEDRRLEVDKKELILTSTGFMPSKLIFYNYQSKYLSWERSTKQKYETPEIKYEFIPIDFDLPNEQIIVSTKKTKITKSDVDINIPSTRKKFENRYALIIGNEDYTTFQSNLKSESNVIFAKNDANVFAQYAERVLGIPKDNIVIKLDAISSVMSREITRIAKLAETSNGEIFFFYAGHGLVDESTKKAYLIPVDIYGSEVTKGIKLGWLYDQFSNKNIVKATIFLDACFSGGGRNQGLVSARSGKIKPKEEQINGNIVVFAATTGEQVALPYIEKCHGTFTYFLLKELQETEGNVKYSELSDYLSKNVRSQTVKTNNVEQIPTTNISISIIDTWKNWRINK